MKSAQSDAPVLPAGFVVQGHGTGYFVKSRTTTGAWWLVAGRSCSCPAGESGAERCWHRDQVAAFVAKINDANRRPRAADTGEAVVSRFVD